MPGQKYDYLSLKHTFITAPAKLSVREVARRAGIPASKVSSVHAQAKKDNWEAQREEYLNRSDDQTLTLLAGLEAKRRLRQAEVTDNAINLIDEAITSARESIALMREVTVDGSKHVERVHRVQLKELNQLIDRLQDLFQRDASDPGDGLSKTPGVVSGITVHADADSPTGAALLAGLGKLAAERSRSAEPRRVGSSPLPDPNGAGAN